MALLDLPQIKSVLEESAKTIFTEWLSTTKNPDQLLNDAAVILSKKLNDEILFKCPSVAEHKLVVVCFVTEQFGQGIRYGGRCIWHAENDFQVSVKQLIENYIVVTTAYFVKISQDASSSQESGESEGEIDKNDQD